jgi:hypothetical protein
MRGHLIVVKAHELRALEGEFTVMDISLRSEDSHLERKCSIKLLVGLIERNKN